MKDWQVVVIMLVLTVAGGVVLAFTVKLPADRLYGDARCEQLYGQGYIQSGGGFSNTLCVGPEGEIKGYRP